MEDEPKRTVVRRYEPPPDDDAPVLRTKLTPEEARALIAVTVVPKGPWDKVKPRLRIAFFVSIAMSILVRLVFGFHSSPTYIAEGIAFLGLVVWIAWPLVFAEKDGWT